MAFKKTVKIYVVQPTIWPGFWRAWPGHGGVRTQEPVATLSTEEPRYLTLTRCSHQPRVALDSKCSYVQSQASEPCRERPRHSPCRHRHGHIYLRGPTARKVRVPLPCPRLSLLLLLCLTWPSVLLTLLGPWLWMPQPCLPLGMMSPATFFFPRFLP